MMIFNEQIVCVVCSCVFLLVSMFFEMFFICCCCCLYSPRCTRSLCFLKQINNMKKKEKNTEAKSDRFNYSISFSIRRIELGFSFGCLFHFNRRCQH